MQQLTTIQIEKETREELKTLGQKGETYNEILEDLIEMAQKSDFFTRQKAILETEEFKSLDEI